MTIKFDNLPEFEAQLKKASEKFEIDVDTTVKLISFEIFVADLWCSRKRGFW